MLQTVVLQKVTEYAEQYLGLSNQTNLQKHVQKLVTAKPAVQQLLQDLIFKQNTSFMQLVQSGKEETTMRRNYCTMHMKNH
jgi:hypothetical protein